MVLIACDGSGSLNHKQMQMLKLLAWLESTAKSEIQVLAGLYHSGSIRPGVSGPLVQWIYHPGRPRVKPRRLPGVLCLLREPGPNPMPCPWRLCWRTR